MNPTPEQLDLWAAEALEMRIKKKHFESEEGYTLGENEEFDYDWHPSTDLSQAWREFRAKLRKRGYMSIVFGTGENGGVALFHKDGIEKNIIICDLEAAPAFVLAFVQAVEPAGYLDWKKKNA